MQYRKVQSVQIDCLSLLLVIIIRITTQNTPLNIIPGKFALFSIPVFDHSSAQLSIDDYHQYPTSEHFFDGYPDRLLSPG